MPIRSPPPIIKIANGTFYRHHPNHRSSQPNPALFSNLTFELPSHSTRPRHWCVVGPSLSGKTSFLQILRGHHLCFPPEARSFPYLSTNAVRHGLKTPHRAIQYVGFDARSGSGLGPATSAHLSARYESRRETMDFSLRDFLHGNTELNPAEASPGDHGIDVNLFEQVIVNLRLEDLLDLPVAFLSNGQGRRARIARALLTGPEVLLLDEPFMGLDPPTVAGLSPLLLSLSPRLILSLRPQDPIPAWVTHLVYLSDCQVEAMGEKYVVMGKLRKYVRSVWTGADMGRTLTKLSTDNDREAKINQNKSLGEPVIEMDGCRVRYGARVVLGNWTEQHDGKKRSGLHWTVRRGQRWGVFGSNGSGKTTVVSLLCSDHPQTYSLPIKLFGRSRLPEPGSGRLPLTFWDIQARIGHSSPEIHQHMPRSLSIRQVLESAWADTFKSRPKVGQLQLDQVDATLKWFEHELNPAVATKNTPTEERENLEWAKEYIFGELSFSAQRVLLFLRAIIKHPDVVVLDEAFGGMDEAVRNKCMLFMDHGEEKTFADSGRVSSGPGDIPLVESEAAKSGTVKVKGMTDNQALICISHIKEEVPDSVREWLCLPEAHTGEPARFGRLDGPLRNSRTLWAEIWGVGRGG